MKFTQGQRDVLERVLGADKLKRPNWFARTFTSSNLISYGFAWSLLGLLAWNVFADGPEWAGNIGGFGIFVFFGLSLILGGALFIMMIMHDDCYRTRGGDEMQRYAFNDDKYKARLKFTLSWIRFGGTFKANWIRSVFVYWGPALFVTVGGGMWFTPLVGVVAACVMWLAQFIIFTKAYEDLDYEMKQDDGTGETPEERDEHRETAVTVDGIELLLKDD